MSDWSILQGDCLEMLRFLGPDSIDSIITDPPYGLEFMGKVWDKDVPVTAVWEACLRVAKPGAFLLAFGGTRTFHRLACAIEDAGWEIRDCVMWVYGSGFPKSHDISKAIDKAAGAEREKIASGKPVKRMIPGADQDKTGSWIKDNGREYQPGTEIPATDAAKQWDGWGTALKPAYEPIIVAMKPLDGTYAQNALEHGVAGLNIDGARVKYQHDADAASATPQGRCTSHDDTSIGAKPNVGQSSARQEFPRPEQKGRWPANVIHDGSEEVVELFPQKSGGSKRDEMTPTTHDGPAKFGYSPDRHQFSIGDDGSAARFFYCAKTSKDERTHKGKVENKHPTVKPIALMEYLCRLTSTPTGGLVLDPFCGSGSTGIAALRMGRKFIGIEKDPESYQLARKRMELDVQEA